MPAEPVNVEQPKHPTSQLTTAEILAYKRQLEHALKTLPGHASVREQQQARLAEVIGEQESRTQLQQNVNRRGTVGL